MKRWANTVVVLALIGLAVTGLAALGRRVEAGVRRYGTEGIEIPVLVTGLTGDAVRPIARTRHEVGGVAYEGSAEVTRPPPAPGSVLVGRYLPDDPRRVRLLPVDAAAARAASEPFRGLQWILGLTGAILVGLTAAPRQGGLVLGTAFVAILLGVNALPDVQATFVRAWGAEVGGVPIAWAVTLAELVVVAPAVLVVAEALVALGPERPTSTAGLAAFLVGRAPQAQRRAQRRLRLAGAYLVALALGWIAWAAANGV